MDVFAMRGANASTGGTTLTVTLPGGRNLYKSLKNYDDLHVTTDTTLPTEQDSEELQFFYIPNLTVDAGKTLTASNRCAGMVIYTDNLVLNGKITMKGKGGKCKKSLHALADLTIPDEIRHAVKVPRPYLLEKAIREGAVNLDKLLEAMDVVTTVTPGTKTLVPALGGKGGAYVAHNSTAVAGTPGAAGSTVGSGATGGGGAGGVWATSGSGYQVSSGGTRGTRNGGGSGGAACGTNSASSYNASEAEDYNGKAGNPPAVSTNQGAGAGNPSGVNTGSGYSQPEDGVGGILIVVCLNSCTIGATGVLDASGSNGGGGNYGGGGGSGGGSVVLIYNQAGTYSNAGSLTAPGGVSANSSNGGAGGAGSTQILTFAQMGAAWS